MNLVKSMPARASKGVQLAYWLVVAAVVSLLLAAPSIAQTSTPGDQMVDQMSTAIIALLGAGVAVVVAVAIFFAAKAFVNRLRS